jgi:outer membrane lipoprotein carrier protein
MKIQTQASTGFKALTVLCALAAALLWTSTALAQVSAGGASLEEILSGIEKRYAGAGFSARFEQRSIMKAMDITDTASGTIWVKRPGKMRWTYETPEEQIIITDGTNLWIYKPEENQVALGHAPAFFAGGKGAGFLSDMKQLREKFDIRLESGNSTSPYVLNLKPIGANLDIAAIYLTVSPDSFEITRIVTYNTYGDENRIDFKDIAYKDTIDDALFTFQIPKGADILQLEEAL